MTHSPAAPRIPETADGQLPAAYTYIDRPARGRTAIAPPRVVFIEVTNHCNLLCETCPRTFVSYERPQTLGWDDFLRIVGQFPDLERAGLHGIGEPLINPDLPRMIAHLKQIWNDTRYQQRRADLLSDHPARPCAGCGVHWSL